MCKEKCNRPIFIRGIMPRSGTNYLADLLKLHSDIYASPNELWEFPHFRQVGLLDNYVNGIANSPKAHAFDAFSFRRYIGKAWLEYLCSYIYNNKRILLKYPSVNDLESTFSYFPDAILLIVIRDGRDLVSSALRSGFVAPAPFSIRNRYSWRRAFYSDFRLLSRMYAVAARQFIEFKKSEACKRNEDRIIVVRYEELFMDTSSLVTKILSFSDLCPNKYDWNKLENIGVRGSSFLRGSDGRMNFSEGITDDGSFKPIGRWHNWSNRERKIFKDEAGSAMDLLEYPIS